MVPPVFLVFSLVWNMYPAGPKQSPGGGPGGEAHGSSKESPSYST